ncbi:WhiB family transcriptional regulator [Streptomyces sp. SID1121]|uniref:WhiB family transcriptional regulator n=1 Tax=Streptomyces sp. SID1121 TaxID=3425888 RepID=UPI0040569F7D
MRYITTHDTPTPVLRGIADHSWHVRGLCHGMPAEDADRLFFPKPRAHQAIAEAKSLCGRCPVKKDCFNHALDNELRQGIWGGLTEAERRPWHAKITKRLDYGRVRAALAGRDVHLSTLERETVIRHAYLRGWSAERLAYLLRADLDWMRDLMREAGHAIADRDRYWDLYDNSDADEDQGQESEPTATDGSAAEDDEDCASPVVRQVHTQALITALGKAA